MTGSNGGARHAKTVCRGALNLRCAAQGRVGDQDVPGTSPIISCHICFFWRNVRSSGRGPSTLSRRGQVLARDGVDGPNAASRPKAQPAECCAPHDGARDTELVQPGRDVIPTSARGQSRGKGVLAA